MRWLELIEGTDGKLDEQAVLSILLGLTLIGLQIHAVLIRGAAFDARSFAETSALFLGGSLGSLTLRSRYSRDGSGNALSAGQ